MFFKTLFLYSKALLYCYQQIPPAFRALCVLSLLPDVQSAFGADGAEKLRKAVLAVSKEVLCFADNKFSGGAYTQEIIDGMTSCLVFAADPLDRDVIATGKVILQKCIKGLKGGVEVVNSLTVIAAAMKAVPLSKFGSSISGDDLVCVMLSITGVDEVRKWRTIREIVGQTQGSDAKLRTLTSQNLYKKALTALESAPKEYIAQVPYITHILVVSHEANPMIMNAPGIRHPLSSV
jgi:hypothetical protein